MVVVGLTLTEAGKHKPFMVHTSSTSRAELESRKQVTELLCTAAAVTCQLKSCALHTPLARERTCDITVSNDSPDLALILLRFILLALICVHSV
jgi:hypothetical protein